MRHKGKVLNWNDEKGFGFVEPNSGEVRAFVHIKAFVGSGRRPVNGEMIIYDLVTESHNRYKAENIQFSAELKKSNKPRSTKNNSHLATYFIFAFCLGLFLSVLTGSLPVIFIGLYSITSAITFIVYAIDKSAAQNDGWRTKESTLHLLSLIGGWPGAYWAQTKLRHKSSKKEFKRIYWLIVLLNVAGVCWLHTDSGIYFINHLIAPLVNG